MGRNGALSIEEWRPRGPPLWVHSTNLLNLLINQHVISVNLCLVVWIEVMPAMFSEHRNRPSHFTDYMKRIRKTYL